MKNENLYGWVFKFNPYTNLWSTTPDSNYFALANGHNDQVISSKNINTLMSIVNKTNGDRNKIKELIKNSNK